MYSSHKVASVLPITSTVLCSLKTSEVSFHKSFTFSSLFSSENWKLEFFSFSSAFSTIKILSTSSIFILTADQFFLFNSESPITVHLIDSFKIVFSFAKKNPAVRNEFSFPAAESFSGFARGFFGIHSEPPRFRTESFLSVERKYSFCFDSRHSPIHSCRWEKARFGMSVSRISAKHVLFEIEKRIDFLFKAFICKVLRNSER